MKTRSSLAHGLRIHKRSLRSSSKRAYKHSYTLRQLGNKTVKHTGSICYLQQKTSKRLTRQYGSYLQYEALPSRLRHDHNGTMPLEIGVSHKEQRPTMEVNFTPALSYELEGSRLQ